MTTYFFGHKLINIFKSQTCSSLYRFSGRSYIDCIERKLCASRKYIIFSFNVNVERHCVICDEDSIFNSVTSSTCRLHIKYMQTIQFSSLVRMPHIIHILSTPNNQTLICFTVTCSLLELLRFECILYYTNFTTSRIRAVL